MIPEPQYRSDSFVELVGIMGDDKSIVRAARVSHLNDTQEAGSEKLIGYLIRHRHGSPVEHVTFTFRIETPVFVARELMRTRMASYNEVSARYTQLPGVFWVPSDDRPVVQTTAAARPEFEFDAELQGVAKDTLMFAYQAVWGAYQRMLDAGVAREVARAALPVGTYTALYMTLNLRSLMKLLSVRTHVEGVSATRSYPQREIEELAAKMEAYATEHCPAAMKAFNDNGRTAP